MEATIALSHLPNYNQSYIEIDKELALQMKEVLLAKDTNLFLHNIIDNELYSANLLLEYLLMTPPDALEIIRTLQSTLYKLVRIFESLDERIVNTESQLRLDLNFIE